MLIKHLFDDPNLIPKEIKKNKYKYMRSAREAFIRIRVRNMFKNLSPLDPNEQVNEVRAILREEMAETKRVYKIILDHFSPLWRNQNSPLGNVDDRVMGRYFRRGMIRGAKLKYVREFNEKLIYSLVWRAKAINPNILKNIAIATPNISYDSSVRLIGRRLRVVLHMLYEVGAVPPLERVWNEKEIIKNPSGPWKDGWNRIFEYPRITTKTQKLKEIFHKNCLPDDWSEDLGRCREQSMRDWKSTPNKKHLHYIGSSHSVHAMYNNSNSPYPKLHFEVDKYWDREAFYQFFLKPASDPILAIESFFNNSSVDFKKRNFLFCDQVVHVLHLEALLEVTIKPLGLQDSFRDEVMKHISAAENWEEEEGWLRIDHSWRDGKYLVSKNEKQYFEHKCILRDELQVGDHLIIFNHPAYDKITQYAIWRLENAIVVQTDPKLLLQGHGLSPVSLLSMKKSMLRLFNTSLEDFRKVIMTTLDHDNPTSTIMTVNTVDDVQLVYRMFVNPTGLRFSKNRMYAHWWVRWTVYKSDDEYKLASETSTEWVELRNKVREIQLVEFSDETDQAGETVYRAYFPLWQPRGKNVSGEITRVDPVVATTKMVDGFRWYVSDQEGCVDVIQPKE